MRTGGRCKLSLPPASNGGRRLPDMDKKTALRLDLTTLKIFLAIIEERNMARAAEREHISAPAVTRRITDLESALGVTLLERHSTGIRLMVAGLALAGE